MDGMEFRSVPMDGAGGACHVYRDIRVEGARARVRQARDAAEEQSGSPIFSRRMTTRSAPNERLDRMNALLLDTRPDDNQRHSPNAVRQSPSVAPCSMTSRTSSKSRAGVALDNLPSS